MDSSSNPDRSDPNTQRTEAEHDNRGKRKDVPTSGDDSSNPSKPTKQQNTRSLSWNHFTRTKEDNDKCKCHHCKRIFGCATKSGTSNLNKHLRSCKQYLAWEGQNTQRVISEEGNLQDWKVSEKVFREASNELIVLAELPLAFIECMAWRYFCNKINMYKPHSRRTATRDIVEMYVDKNASLKDWISVSQQRVSLTTDIWVAQITGASYMVITMHFIDAKWRLRKLIIGFKYITDHKGATISRILLECLAEWGVEKIFTITVDNATANTSALRRFQSSFKLLRNDSLVLKGELMHMRCCAHIINLIVKEGLHELGKQVEAIRNAVQYVRSSTSRCDSFELKVVSGKMIRGSLPMDVKTRWNSTYLMLSRAMKFKLAFDRMEAEDKLYNDYFTEVENGNSRIGPPTTSDWMAIERLVKFLGLFYTSTLIVSASTSVCSYKCYGEIVTIEKNLMVMSNSLDTELKSKAIEMKEKFEKYWEGTKNINRMLIIASVFDPRQKMQFAKMCFEKLYGKDTVDAKEMFDSVYLVMRSLFTEYSVNYQGSNAQSSQSNPSSSNIVQEHFTTDSSEFLDDDFIEFERMDCAYKEIVDEIGIDTRDELEIYLKEKVENPKTMLGSEWDVLSWWRLNAHKYPVLSEIARDVLAMQVTSVASESAFSTSKRILEPHRSCLTHYMVEVLMCTEQWLKCDINLSENSVLTNAQLLADVELFDKLEKEFQSEMNFN